LRGCLSDYSLASVHLAVRFWTPSNADRVVGEASVAYMACMLSSSEAHRLDRPPAPKALPSHRPVFNRADHVEHPSLR